jgi:hypothetical protein
MMIEETHRRLAIEIGKALNLDAKSCKLLEDGSAVPDYQETFPHHYGKGTEIKNLLKRARATFQKHDNECYYLLGMAFHYIQDKWTLRVRTRDKHTKWEDMVNKAEILDKQGFIKHLKSAAIPSKFQEAYLTYLEILENEVESPVFWKEIADEELHVSWRYAQKEKEKGMMFGRRLITIINAWNEDEKRTNTPWLKIFKNLYDDDNWGKTRLVRYTTPTIDLNIAYVLCREVGKRVLSDGSKWDFSDVAFDKAPISAEVSWEKIESARDAWETRMQ